MHTSNWRLWCVTEQAWVYTQSESEPTECPNDSGHTIDPNLTVIESSVMGDTLSSIQLKRSTNFDVPSDWSDIPFDVTNLENNAEVLEHDDTNTDRINIHQAGLYFVFYQCVVDLGVESRVDFRVRKNDNTVLVCSDSYVAEGEDYAGDASDHYCAGSFLVELDEGDFISLQADEDGSGCVVQAGLVLGVIKLETGPKGDKGDTGPQGPAGSIFGQEFQEASSLGQSSHNLTSYEQKLRLTTGDLPEGTYRIGWSYRWRMSHNDNKDFKARIQINDSTTIMEHQQEVQDTSYDQKHRCSGFYYAELSGVKNIDLDFCIGCYNYQATAYIEDARLEIWRVE